MLNDIAWEIIDHWITKEYGGDEDALRDEVGNLNDYAYRIANAIEMHDRHSRHKTLRITARDASLAVRKGLLCHKLEYH